MATNDRKSAEEEVARRIREYVHGGGPVILPTVPEFIAVALAERVSVLERALLEISKQWEIDPMGDNCIQAILNAEGELERYKNAES